MIKYRQMEEEKVHPVLIAAYLHDELVRIHPFIDGNKRIGTQLMLILLKKSGIELFYTQEELIEVILHVADGTIGYEELLTWVLEHS